MERYRRVSKNRPLDPNKPRPEVKLDAKRSRLFSNVLEDIENEATSSGTTLSSSLIKISTLIIMIEFYILNLQFAFIRKFVLDSNERACRIVKKEIRNSKSQPEISTKIIKWTKSCEKKSIF